MLPSHGNTIDQGINGMQVVVKIGDIEVFVPFMKVGWGIELMVRLC